MHVVDLLVAHTRGAMVEAGGGDALASLVDAAVARANIVFQNSDAHVRVRVSGSLAVDWEEYGNLFPSLAFLERSGPNDGPNEIVAASRDSHDADLVCLVTASTDTKQFLARPGPSETRPFSVVTIAGLRDGTRLPVALSVNLGCQTDSAHGNAASGLSFGHGYLFSIGGESWGTIETDAPHRVPLFSNPRLQYRGLPMGIPEGLPGAADNARALDLTAPIVAKFRGDAPRSIPPTITLSAPPAGITFIAGDLVPLTVSVVPGQFPVQRVDLFDRRGRIGSRTNAPYNFVWQAGPDHEDAILAIAVDATGASTAAPETSYIVKAANDGFARRILLSGDGTASVADETDATLEPGEPSPPSQAMVGSLWWTWHSPANGHLEVKLTPSVTRLRALAAYSGDWLPGLLPFAEQFGIGVVQLGFDVEAGEDVQFQVSDFLSLPLLDDPRGLVALTSTFSAAPRNDDFRRRETLVGDTDGSTVTLAGASHEAGEIPGRSAWWTWTAPADGVATWSSGSVTECIAMGVYTGIDPGGFRTIAENYCGAARFMAFKDQTYQLSATLPGGSPDPNQQLSLRISLHPHATNDEPYSPAQLVGDHAQLSGDLGSGTADSPASLNNPSTLWWRWIPATNGLALLRDGNGLDFKPYLPGQPPSPAPTLQPARDDGTVFPVSGGTPYLILAAGDASRAMTAVSASLRLSTVRITEPAAGAEAIDSGPVAMAIESTPVDGTLASVEFRVDGSPVGRLTKAPWRFPWMNPVGGNHVLSVFATNTDGDELAVAPVPFGVRPANDRFDLATPLAGTHLLLNAASRGATLEPREPPAGFNFNGTTWWRWTAPSNGLLRLGLSLSADQKGHQQEVAVFTGDALGALAAAPLRARSGTVFDTRVIGGITYDIRVASTAIAWDVSRFGPAQLGLDFIGQPENDNYANATAVVGTPVDFAADTTAASAEPNEKDANGQFASTSVWWKWTAPITRAVVLGIQGQPEIPRVSVFQTPRIPIASNVSVVADRDTNLIFTATEGITYYIAADGLNTASTVRLRLEQKTLSPNDDPDHAIAITLAPGILETQVTGDNRWAVRTTDEPSDYIHGVWYRFDAPQRGSISVSVRSPDTIARLGIYKGGPGAWTRLARSNNDDPYSALRVNVEAGESYFIEVGTQSTQKVGGLFTLTIDFGARSPNDDFASRIQLAGSDVKFEGTPLGATHEAGIPPVAGDLRTDIWYEWKAPIAGLARVTSVPELSGAVLMVYAGTDPAHFREVSSAGWSVRAGDSAFLRFIGDFPYTFHAQLAVSPAPSNDDFAARELLTGDAVAFSGAIQAATREPGEPSHGPALAGYGHTVWYSWTAPASGTATLETIITNNAVRAAVYEGSALADLKPVPFGGTNAIGSFRVEAGKTYQLAIDGQLSNYVPPPAIEFASRLAMVARPANDDFAARQPFTTTRNFGEQEYRGEIFADLRGATAEPGEPGHVATNRPASRSVWYSYVPPVDGYLITASVGTAVLYQGASLQELVRAEIGPFGNWVVSAGVPYALAVDSDQAGVVRVVPLLEPWVTAEIVSPFDGVRRNSTSLTLAVNFTDTRPFNIDATVLADGVAIFNTNKFGYPHLVTVANLAPGLHEFVAVAHLSNGHGATSAPVHVTITSAPPTNDAFANRVKLTGAHLNLTGFDGLNATSEPGEPLALPFGAGETTWWEWTAPTNGWVRLDAMSDGSVPIVGIYRGNTVSELTRVGSHWDNYASDHRVPPRSYPVRNGEAYQIQVDFPPSSLGPPASRDIRFYAQETEAPPNDDFVHRTHLTGSSVGDPAVLNTGTAEPGEPDNGGTALNRTLWWTWTAPNDGQVDLQPLLSMTDPNGFPTVRPPNAPPPVLAVFTGDHLDQLHPVARDTNGGTVRLRVQSGVAYQIQFGEPDGSDSYFFVAGLRLGFTTLHWAEPSRRDLDQGDPIALQTSDPDPALDGEIQSVAFAVDDTVFPALQAPPFALGLSDVTIGVHRLQAHIVFKDGRTTDLIPQEIEVHEVHRIPENDRFDRAIGWTDSTETALGSFILSTREPGEPNHSLPVFGPVDGGSLWWDWTSPGTGDATVRTDGNALVSVFVYTGDSLGSLLPVAAGPHATAFHANREQHYRIALVSQATAFSMTLNGPTAPPTGRLAEGRIMADGTFRLGVTGSPGQSFAVLVSTDLVRWEIATVETLTGSSMELAEDGSLGDTQRFYRFVALEDLVEGLTPAAVPSALLRRVGVGE